MTIPIPDEDEKDRAVEAILSKGLIQRKSLFRQICELYRVIGFQSIFHDTAGGIILASGAALGLCLFFFRTVPDNRTCGMLFAVSPLFYLLLSLASEINERICGLYELKMTCKYTVRQICAFRMLCFSAAGMVFCALISAIVCSPAGFVDFWNMLAISLCSLFLCSLLSVKLALSARRRWAFYLLPAIWLAICILPAETSGMFWDQFLLSIPSGVILALMIALAYLYLREIKNLLSHSGREAFSYVNG